MTEEHINSFGVVYCNDQVTAQKVSIQRMQT